MRSKLLLLVPCVLVGCTDDSSAPPGDVVILTDDETSSGWTEWIEDAPRDIVATLDVSTVSCDAPIGRLEGGARYADDLSIVPDVTCQFQFADGSVVDGCVIDHEFPSGGAHPVLLVVTDPASGVCVIEETVAFVHEPLLVDLEVRAPACGLEVSWVATVSTTAETHVFVEPAAKIVTDDPLYHLNRTYTLEVSEPGTYTVRLDAEDERTTGDICRKELTREVTVVACADDHEHTPDCVHD